MALSPLSKNSSRTDFNHAKAAVQRLLSNPKGASSTTQEVVIDGIITLSTPLVQEVERQWGKLSDPESLADIVLTLTLDSEPESIFTPPWS